MRLASTRLRAPRENWLRWKRSAPHPPRTRTTVHRQLRPPPQIQTHATIMQPLHCILQHDVTNPHLSIYMTTKKNYPNHAAITLRSAYTGSKIQFKYVHMNNHALQNTKGEPIKLGTTAAATAARISCLSSPAAASQAFVFRLPPQHNPHIIWHLYNHYDYYFPKLLFPRITIFPLLPLS